MLLADSRRKTWALLVSVVLLCALGFGSWILRSQALKEERYILSRRSSVIARKLSPCIGQWQGPYPSGVAPAEAIRLVFRSQQQDCDMLADMVKTSSYAGRPQRWAYLGEDSAPGPTSIVLFVSPGCGRDGSPVSSQVLWSNGNRDLLSRERLIPLLRAMWDRRSEYGERGQTQLRSLLRELGA